MISSNQVLEVSRLQKNQNKKGGNHAGIAM